MPTPNVFLKDPSAVIDFTIDWLTDGYLDATVSPDETISTSAWSIDPTPSPAELVADSDSKTTTTTTVTLSGGTAGKVYRVTNTITTSESRTEQRTVTVRVGDR